MAQPWPKEIHEAIWALRCDGCMPTEITRRLNEGDAVLKGKPCPIKRPTVVAKLERFYKERGKPELNIAPGTELEVANAELRTILTWARNQRRWITEREVPEKDDIADVTKLTTLIAKCETAIRDSRTVRDKNPDKVDAGRTAKRPDKDILSQIAASEKARKRGDVGGQPAVLSTNDEPPPSATPDPIEDPHTDSGSRAGESSFAPWSE